MKLSIDYSSSKLRYKARYYFGCLQFYELILSEPVLLNNENCTQWRHSHWPFSWKLVWNELRLLVFFLFKKKIYSRMSIASSLCGGTYVLRIHLGLNPRLGTSTRFFKIKYMHGTLPLGRCCFLPFFLLFLPFLSNYSGTLTAISLCVRLECLIVLLFAIFYVSCMSVWALFLTDADLDLEGGPVKWALCYPVVGGFLGHTSLHAALQDPHILLPELYTH